MYNEYLKESKKMNNNNDFQIHPHVLRQIQENRNWYLGLGIGLVVLGSLAIIFSFLSTLISVVYLGLLIIIVGIFEGVKAFKINLWANFFLHLFLSIFYIVGGFFITLNPALSALSLTLLLAIFFVVSGILRIIFGLAKHVPHKGWLILNGVVTLALGLLIWYEWPYSGLWVIGTFIGIDAIFTGWTWIMLSMATKKLK